MAGLRARALAAILILHACSVLRSFPLPLQHFPVPCAQGSCDIYSLALARALEHMAPAGALLLICICYSFRRNHTPPLTHAPVLPVLHLLQQGRLRAKSDDSLFPRRLPQYFLAYTRRPPFPRRPTDQQTKELNAKLVDMRPATLRAPTAAAPAVVVVRTFRFSPVLAGV
jgi:hypothetical protein